VSVRLLAALPVVAVLHPTDWGSSLPQALAAEAVRDGPGQEAYLDRLVDLLLLDFLRTWFDRPGNSPSWWAAESDALVGPALRLMYNNPSHRWTVANLAAAVGTSRATFARRFAALVGEPPMAFLTAWRLALAADALESSEATVAAVARQVGYSTAFALSTAFKRAHGLSPAAYRAKRTWPPGSPRPEAAVSTRPPAPGTRADARR
jgi:AraC-like DNA-binding protein